MRKITLLLFLVFGITNAQIINISDPNFKAALLAADVDNNHAGGVGGYINIDSDSDGEIQVSEAMAVTSLNLPNKEIVSVTGLSNFTNLTSLVLDGNYLTAFDPSGLNNLQSISLRQNLISSLAISGLPNLSDLLCDSNNMVQLNIDNCPNLTILQCGHNTIGVLDLSSVPSLQIVDCFASQISSLNVSGLTDLLDLRCDYNQLTALDLSTNINLETLNCSSNQLTTLSITPGTPIITIDCSQNQLTALNLTGLSGLTSVLANSNLLSALDVSGQPNLLYLEFAYNSITTIDLSQNANLLTLLCTANQITSLDLANVPMLNTLSCDNNPLTALDMSPIQNTLTSLIFGNSSLPNIDLSNLTHLSYFHYSGGQQTSLNMANMPGLWQFQCHDAPNITQIDLSNNPILLNVAMSANANLEFLNIKNGGSVSMMIQTCPNILHVCANEADIPFVIQNLTDLNNTPNVSVNSYCSFTPGGAFNTISGTAHFDMDNNGCDSNDFAMENIRIGINDGTMTGATFTNGSGIYNFLVQQPNLMLTPSIENPSYFNISPALVSLNFPQNNNLTEVRDFCISPNGIHPDVQIVIVPSVPARPGFDASYQLIYSNVGNQVVSGALNFAYDESVLDFVSATTNPDSQNPAILNWNYTNLAPFEHRTIEITFNVNAPTETPPVNIGDLLDFSANITLAAGSDEMPADNQFDVQQTVIGSFDPNNKICLQGANVSPTDIGKYLHYVINFENTGTAAAENIVIRDMIDSSKFDIASLQMVNTSHDAQIKITGNKIEFIFENIQLQPNEHGNVVFKIKTKNTLAANDIVTNKADIFFDYNFPIETNTATTAFQLLNTHEFKTDNSISVSPNPVSDILHIKAGSSIKSVALFDMQGRIVTVHAANDFQTELNISGISNAIYFIKIITDEGIRIEKIIKE